MPVLQYTPLCRAQFVGPSELWTVFLSMENIWMFLQEHSYCKRKNFIQFFIIVLVSACIQEGEYPTMSWEHIPWVAGLQICKKLWKESYFYFAEEASVAQPLKSGRRVKKTSLSLLQARVNNLLEMAPRGSSMEDGYCMLIVLACCVLAPAAKPRRNVFFLSIAVLPHDSLCSQFYFRLMAHLTSAQQHSISFPCA